MILGHTIKDYKRENLLHDVITGIIIMAVSIPISMGYSQIAGLPAVYGLYGSVFPIILFALFSTSPQFIFGVDAAPAALVGSALLGMNIQSGSKEALAVVPVITFFVALWLLAFYLMHFSTSYGWIYYRNLFDDHFDASAEINGRNSRNWRIIRTVRAYRKNSRTDQSSIIDLRNPIISHLVGSEKDHAEIPNGSCDDGSRSCFDAGSANERMGN